MTKIFFITIFSLLTICSPAMAGEKIKVIASFSIITNMAHEVAGDNIELKALVGANGDAHEYEPTPSDAKLIAKADLVLVNGLGFEGWMDRLIKSSGYKGKVITVSSGSKLIQDDPHAWQDIANGIVYVENIKNALIEADKAHSKEYTENASAYIKKLGDLDKWVKSEIGKIPANNRKVISTHDAFQYFSQAYGIEFISALGMSTESQASAADIAKLIDQVRNGKVKSVFLENMTDSRLMKQLEKDAGAHIGGTLYSDSLSAQGEPAPDYITMFRHNVQELVKAMGK